MTARPIPADVRDLLAKLLQRLASSFEGQRVATLAAIECVLGTHGLSMHDIVAGLEASPPPSPPLADPPIEDDDELDGRPQFLPAGQLLTRVDQIERRGAFLGDSSRILAQHVLDGAPAGAGYGSPTSRTNDSATWSAQ